MDIPFILRCFLLKGKYNYYSLSLSLVRRYSHSLIALSFNVHLYSAFTVAWSLCVINTQTVKCQLQWWGKCFIVIVSFICSSAYYRLHLFLWTQSPLSSILKLIAWIKTTGVFFSTKKCAFYLIKFNFVFVS